MGLLRLSPCAYVLFCLSVPRRGSGVCNLSQPEFSGLLALSRNYYKNGVFEMADIDWVAQFLNGDRTAFESVCAAAVLQALLLKLEENMIYEDKAYEALMAEYARYMHNALLVNGISREDLLEWPLAEGLKRVKALSEKLSRQHRFEGLTSAMVMNFCRAEDRFGEVHALEWLFSTPFGDPADPALDGEEAGLLNHTDLYIYVVDKPWCTGLSQDTVQRLQRVVRDVFVIRYTGGPGREEQSAYFKYLADHYDTLPDFTIFTHPDAPEHQGVAFPALRRALKLIRTGSKLAWQGIGYYPLALQMVVEPRRAWGTRYLPSWVRFWQHLFRKPWKDFSSPAPTCMWESHPGTFLSGLIDGVDARLPRHRAKSACVESLDCVGITCGTPIDPLEPRADDLIRLPGLRRGSCTVRRGSEGLIPSPEREISYLKLCTPDASESVQTEAASDKFSDAHTPGWDAALAFKTTYSRHDGSYMPDYANGDDTVRNLEAAKARCDQLGTRCGGVTCEVEADAGCTVRAGEDVMSSPFGEVAYKKNQERTPLSETPVSRLLPEQLPFDGGPNTSFQFYTGSQSIIHKDRLRLIPREWFTMMAADGPFCSEFTGYLEAVWHAMFGEPLNQWPREHDPKLPLYLKWGVPSLYSYGDEGVV